MSRNPPGHICSGPTSREAAAVRWWKLIHRVLGRGGIFAADALKRRCRALPREWVGMDTSPGCIGGGAASPEMGKFLLNSNTWAQGEGEALKERKEEVTR